MDQIPTKEGHVPLSIPSIETPCSTYYKVIGDLNCGTPPVIMLHGGPGGGHEYLLDFAQLWPRCGVPVVFYDQIGCGASTHLPQTAGDRSFWTVELFVTELNNLIDHLQIRSGPGFHLFGQSWGGILAVEFATRRPIGLRRLVLSSALASDESMIRGVRLIRNQLPPEAEATLVTAEQTGDWSTPAVREVQAMVNSKHVCRANPTPPLLVRAMKNLSEDTTVYQTMLGKSWLSRGGSLDDWTSVPRLHQITAPTLVYNGEYDSSHDVTTVPFFELIPRVRWITFANAGHFCHLESAELLEKILTIVGDFLVQA